MKTIAVPETISEAQADCLGMPVSFYERAVRFGGSLGTIVAPPQSERAQPCCGEYATCGRPCTPRGRWIAERRMNAAFDAIINAGSLGHARWIAIQAKEDMNAAPTPNL